MTWFRPRQPAMARWRDHRLITVAVALSVVPRLLAVLAFRPALFTPDSFAYLAEGARPPRGRRHCKYDGPGPAWGYGTKR